MSDAEIACAFGKKASKKLCKELGVKLRGSYGFSFRVAASKSHSIYAACFNVPKKASYEQVMALIAHESCHLADRYFETLEETEIGEEAYAYTVQFMSLCIMRKYRQWVLKHVKR